MVLSTRRQSLSASKARRKAHKFPIGPRPIFTGLVVGMGLYLSPMPIATAQSKVA
jgi:hypothetical protein